MIILGLEILKEADVHRRLLEAEQRGRDEQRRLECSLTHSLLRDSEAYRRIAERELGRPIRLTGIIDKLIEDAAAGRKTKNLRKEI